MTTATLENTLLDVDFYHVQELLSDEEQGRAVRIRDYLEREVTPIIEDYWERAEFPHQIKPGFPELGVYGPLWEESRLWENTAALPRLGRPRVRPQRRLRRHLRRRALRSRHERDRHVRRRRPTRRVAAEDGPRRARSAPSASPSRCTAPTPRAASRPPPAATATSGCSTAPSAGSATPPSRMSW